MSNITESVSDTLALSDGASVNFGYLFSEGPSFTDLAMTNFGYFFGDTNTLSDAEKQLLGMFSGPTDQIGLSDFIQVSTYQKGFAVFDSLRLSDSAAATVPFVTGVGDTISLSDSIGAGLFGVSDTNTLSDAISIGMAHLVSDSFTFSDAAVATTINAFLAVTESVADTIPFYDSIQLSGKPFGAAVGDRMLFSDSVGVVLQSAGTSYLRRYLNDAI